MIGGYFAIEAQGAAEIASAAGTEAGYGVGAAAGPYVLCDGASNPADNLTALIHKSQGGEDSVDEYHFAVNFLYGDGSCEWDYTGSLRMEELAAMLLERARSCARGHFASMDSDAENCAPAQKKPVNKRYWVTMRIDARFIAEVEAPDIPEAIKKANDVFSEADFGEASDIMAESVAVEDESGIRWERT